MSRGAKGVGITFVALCLVIVGISLVPSTSWFGGFCASVGVLVFVLGFSLL